MISYTVNSAKSLVKCQDALEQLFNDKKFMVVQVRTGRDRSENQNALSFAYYNKIARHDKQEDINGWRSLCKLEIGVPIMLEDESFAEKYNAMIRGRFSYEEKRAFMLEPFDFPVTRLMNKEQFGRYIDMIEKRWPAIEF